MFDEDLFGHSFSVSRFCYLHAISAMYSVEQAHLLADLQRQQRHPQIL